MNSHIEDRLRYALQEIINSIPAHDGKGSGFWSEHYGLDGENLGEYQVNAEDIIENIVSIATCALDASTDEDREPISDDLLLLKLREAGVIDGPTVLRLLTGEPATITLRELVAAAHALEQP